MIDKKVTRTVFKNGFFLSLGAVALLGYVSAQMIGVSPELHPTMLKTATETIGWIGALATVLSGVLTLVLLGQKGGIVGGIALERARENTIKIGEKIYTKYKDKELLSSEEVAEKKLFQSFFHNIGNIALIDLPLSKETTPFKISPVSKEEANNALLKKAYIEHCFDKNTSTLGKLFIKVLNYDIMECVSDKDVCNNYDEKIAFKCFKTLFEINPFFTQADQKYITQELKKLNKVGNSLLAKFMSERENFTKLSEENRKLFLKVAGDKIVNRDELITLFNQQTQSKKNKDSNKETSIEEQEMQSIKVLENKPVVINELSYQNFASFKSNLLSLYNNHNEEKLNSVLNQIEAILLVREQLEQVLLFTTEKDSVDLKMFLTQDIDKVVHSFNREVNILHKMKIMKHPDLEKNKTFILDNIASRIEMIVDKIQQCQNTLHESLTDELKSEYEVNQKVLSAKMG